MEEWKEYKVEDIYSVQNGYAFRSGDFYDDYVEPSYEVLKIGHIEIGGGMRQSPKRSYVDRLPKYKRWVLQKGDIVMGMTDMKNNIQILGVPAMVERSDHYVLNQRVGRLTIKDSNSFDNDFFYFQMRSMSFLDELRKKANSGVQVNLTTEAIKTTSLFAPSFDKQKQIGKILRCLEDKIELNNRINHNLEEQAQALFKSWFVDFEPFKQEQFVNTEMGLIPKDWSIVPFFDIVRLCSGGTPKTDQPDYWGGNIPFFTPKDVSSSPFCLKTEKYITKTGLDHCNSHLYEPFTTFITARGTVGKLCMTGYPMAMNQTNYAICSINIDPILAFLFSKQIVNNLKNKANGAVFDAITTRDFEGERVIMAPDSILSEFSSTIRPLYNQILENEKQSFALSKTRELVLPALMTGQTINHNC